MTNILLTIHSRLPHVHQILTGFSMLPSNSFQIVLDNRTDNADNPDRELGFLTAKSDGMKIVYDVLDGYQWPDAMKRHLTDCDYYFKRSFSEKENTRLFPDLEHKIRPLGFNYHVTYPGNPLEDHINKRSLRSIAKNIAGLLESWQFTTGVFETPEPVRKEHGFRIIFYTRLWDPQDVSSEKEACERRDITQVRIETIRQLRKAYPKEFRGGLSDTIYARQVAPDLIVPAIRTARSNYLKEMRGADICIGTMGLHESIGWKTGEYVAAGKAIVHEIFGTTLPGDFCVEKNYLSFVSPEECVCAVDTLLNDPERIYRMKCENRSYYEAYLRPDNLVLNTLRTAGMMSC